MKMKNEECKMQNEKADARPRTTFTGPAAALGISRSRVLLCSVVRHSSSVFFY